MNLHNQIMNIPAEHHKQFEAVIAESRREVVYRQGHRDARHAAAELSLKHDAYIEALEKMLIAVLPYNSNLLSDIRKEVGLV